MPTLAKDKKHWITVNGAHFEVDDDDPEKLLSNILTKKKQAEFKEKGKNGSSPRSQEEIDPDEWYYVDRHGEKVRTKKNQEKQDKYKGGELPRNYIKLHDKPMAKRMKDYRPTHANDNCKVAQDESLRTYDAYGRLHVASSNISKAMVCPYFGYEIPDYEALNLEKDKIYNLLRDPQELEKAAPTFRNLQILEIHKTVDAKEPARERTVGTTGSDVEFDGEYLKCSLAIWDETAIAGINARTQVELSSAYRYTPDMTPGTFKGESYDGIMRDIIGNHVALVENGRAGSDVVVADSKIYPQKLTRQGEKMAISRKDARAALRVALAQDEKIDKELLILALDEEPEDDEEWEDDPDNPGQRRKKEKAVAEDEDETEEEEDDEDEDKEKDKPAMDAASVQLAIDTAVKKAKADMAATYQAQKDVLPLVGNVVMDSAEDIYKFALNKMGVDTKGVHPSAYGAMINILKSNQTKKPIAEDKRPDTIAQFPGLKRFKGA